MEEGRKREVDLGFLPCSARSTPPPRGMGQGLVFPRKLQEKKGAAVASLAFRH